MRKSKSTSLVKKMWAYYISAFAFIFVAPSVVYADGESLSVGTGKAKLNALLQTWALNDTTAANDANSNFRIRRSEIKLSGSVHPNTRWFVMIDPAKSLSISSTGTLSSANDNKILQDIGAGLNLTEDLELVLGQFKIPIFAESLQPSSELLLPERSYIGRIFGDRREPGIMLDYNPKPIRLRLMASNGQVTPGGAGSNIDDTNNSKDINGRVDYSVTSEFKVGVFGSQSHSTAGSGNRWGADVQYSTERVFLRIGGVQAKEIDIDKNGLATEAGYQFNDKFQGAFRYENFHQTTAPELASDAYSLGFNYFVAENSIKLQLAQTLLKNMTGSNGSPKPSAGRDGSMTVLNLQTAL